MPGKNIPLPSILNTAYLTLNHPTSARPLAVCILVLILAGSPMPACADNSPDSSASKTEPAPISGGTIGSAFSTRHARFQPVTFDQIPGWHDENLLASFRGLSQSCAALAHKPAWSGLCGEIAGLGADTGTIRQFFQRNFFAYQISSPGTLEGRISGYFKPVVQGSRERRGGYQFPVYGPPHDLLLLDGKSLTGAARQFFVVDNGVLRPPSIGDVSAREYRIALASQSPDNRDERFRVRVESDQILPYYSRQEIAQRALDAPILAWVNDPLALYSIHVQGIGYIQMGEGDMLGLELAEHNGQPLVSRNRVSELGAIGGVQATRGRRTNDAGSGKRAELSDEDLFKLIAGLDSEPEAAAAPPSSTKRQASADRPVPAIAVKRPADLSPPTTGKAPVSGTSSAPTTDRLLEIKAMVAALSRPAASTRVEPAVASGSAAVVNFAPISRVAGQGSMNVEPAAVAAGASGLTGFMDPGYVFFRRIADSGTGTIGALGVPLTAGRSLSVDPLIAPLGSPVFISTNAPGNRGSIQRLMFAQDTSPSNLGQLGGELFWGAGETARRLAEATHGSLQMWVLLPRVQQSNPGQDQVNLGSACAVDDPDFCAAD